jgi:hypothetical protein
MQSAAVEQVFISPSYPNGSDSVNSRNDGLRGVVPVSPD